MTDTFIGDAEAGQTSAVLFTIIEACRRRRIAPPWEYLREVLTRLLSITNSHLGEVMLDAWGKARAPGPGFGYGSSLTRPMVARSQAAT